MRTLSETRRLRNELRRLKKGPEPEEKPGGMGIVRFVVYCPHNSSQVLNRAREVLGIVLKRGTQSWPSDNEWFTLLPDWFISKCAPECSKEESEKWLSWWKGLPPDKQAEVVRKEKWSVLDWIYWFKPGKRQWFWWDALVKGEDMFIVAVEVDGWPFPWDALGWLLRASGATSVEPES